LFQYGNIGVGVFPEGEEILIGRFGCNSFVFHGKGSTDLEMRRRTDELVHNDAAIVIGRNLWWLRDRMFIEARILSGSERDPGQALSFAPKPFGVSRVLCSGWHQDGFWVSLQFEQSIGTVVIARHRLRSYGGK
jgi:hypothetical protein